MSYIETLENSIVAGLEGAFAAPKPYVTSDITIKGDMPTDEIQKDAKVHATDSHGKSAIFVAFTGRSFKEKKGGIYYPFYVFTIFMFASNRRKRADAHNDIYDLLETSVDKLFTMGYELFEDQVVPVKNEKTGLYQSVLIVGKHQPYPN